MHISSSSRHMPSPHPSPSQSQMFRSPATDAAIDHSAAEGYKQAAAFFSSGEWRERRACLLRPHHPRRCRRSPAPPRRSAEPSGDDGPSDEEGPAVGGSANEEPISAHAPLMATHRRAEHTRAERAAAESSLQPVVPAAYAAEASLLKARRRSHVCVASLLAVLVLAGASLLPSAPSVFVSASALSAARDSWRDSAARLFGLERSDPIVSARRA